MSRALRQWAFLGAPAVALVALASHAQTTTPLPSRSYAFSDIDQLWQRATRGMPADASWITFLNQQVRVSDGPAASTPPAGGVIDLEEEAPAAPSGTTATHKVLPVASLPCAVGQCSTAEDLHRRTALLEQVITALRSYREVSATEAAIEDKVRRLGNAAHLELFIAYSLAYLEGETRDDKCTSYRRATDHARLLGFVDGSAGDPAPVRSGWEGTLASARSFYTDAFSHQIPSGLCELRAPSTKSQTESDLRTAIAHQIDVRVTREIDATLSALTAKQTEYATKGQAAVIDVPTRKIFALQRAVEDSASLEAFVASDVLYLQRAPEGAKSSLTLLREAVANLTDIARRADKTEITQLETEARSRLAGYNEILGRIAEELRSIANLPGLEAATSASMPACRTIPDALTEQNFTAYADTFNRCVTQVAGAYSALKDRRGDAPTYTPFVQKVTALSGFFIAASNPSPQ